MCGLTYVHINSKVKLPSHLWLSALSTCRYPVTFAELAWHSK